MDDMISRQKAIDALGEKPLAWEQGEYEEGLQTQWESEIVRCCDCKHHWTHKCMDSMPIERCDLEQTFYDAEVDYCSLAERRNDG